MIIETKNLTKTYKLFEKEAGLRGSIKSLFKRKFSYKTALSNFNLTVSKGEFIGLIGPNGAGKTTLVKMLTGIIAPTLGELSVLGFYPPISFKMISKNNMPLLWDKKASCFLS